jgi:hypothetical protein
MNESIRLNFSCLRVTQPIPSGTIPRESYVCVFVIRKDLGRRSLDFDDQGMDYGHIGLAESLTNIGSNSSPLMKRADSSLISFKGHGATWRNIRLLNISTIPVGSEYHW